MPTLKIVVISEVGPVVGRLPVLLRALGHEPIAILTVRHDGAQDLDMNEIVRAAPSDLDVVIPAFRSGIAPLLRHYAPDLALCIGFPWKIPAEALAVPRHGIVNGHPSLLPRFRGPSPVSSAIRHGESEIGFTFHYMDHDLDTGNILAQARIPLGGERSWEELTPKLEAATGALLPTVLERVAMGDPGEPQDEQLASYHGEFGSDYVWIDWSRTADEIERQVRAWGFQSRSFETRGALAVVDGETIRVLRASVEPAEGRAMECGDGTIWIVESEPA